jgi:Xaa-Pro dipeptidase
MIGEPNAARSNAAERLVALQDRQIEAMVAGADARTVDAVLRDAVLAEGLREVYTNTSGYTLGLYGWTPRVSDFTYNFHPGSNWALEEGMVLHMVTSAQGLGFSETVAVTAAGPKRLTQTPRTVLVAG